MNHDVVFDFDAGLQGYNLFVYSGNNPVNRIDRLGTDSRAIDECDSNLGDEIPKGGFGGGGGSNGSPTMGSSGVPSYHSNSSSTGKLSNHSVAMSESDALEAAIDFWGSNYYEAATAEPGRFVSADGVRQVHMFSSDLLGLHAGAPHVYLGFIGSSFSFHIYLMKG